MKLKSLRKTFFTFSQYTHRCELFEHEREEGGIESECHSYTPVKLEDEERSSIDCKR
jgi:hypothetical protein